MLILEVCLRNAAVLLIVLAAFLGARTASSSVRVRSYPKGRFVSVMSAKTCLVKMLIALIGATGHVTGSVW